MDPLSAPKPRIRGNARSIERAFVKAQLLDVPAELATEQDGQRWFRVMSASRSGLAHTVRQDRDGVLLCSCEAAMNDRVCWHLGAVTHWLARQARRAHRGGARPDPSPTTRRPSLQRVDLL